MDSRPGRRTCEPPLRPALGQHEPFGLQHAQRLAHGGAAQPRLRDQFTFGGKRRTLGKPARQDQLAQLRGEHVRCLGHDNGGEVQRHADYLPDTAPLWALAGRLAPSAYYLSNKIIRPKWEGAMPESRSGRARGDRHRRRDRRRRRDRAGAWRSAATASRSSTAAAQTEADESVAACKAAGADAIARAGRRGGRRRMPRGRRCGGRALRPRRCRW